ncbi:MAG TPA: stage III sporulation protein AE [Candidatus Mediterraneibacter norfolkensis]|nr:stage III sporulation protein AE [Candidatus Mediterraneibacter norfolkensis]
MRRGWSRLFQVFLTLVLILVVFGLGTRIVSAEETADAEAVREETENALMEEFDLDEIEESLSGMFPRQKISFEEVLSELVSGDWSELGKTFLGYLGDRIFYEFRYNRENLVYMLMVALTAAVFTNFSSAFQNRQVSEISFYVLYMLLITLCLTAFRIAAQGLEENLDALVDFMRVLCPSYFLAVAFASGSVTSLFFYNVILFLIYVVELVVVRFLLPVINVYIMIQVLGNLTGEDFLSEFAQLLQKLVSWVLKSLLAGVIGINVVQGLLAPVIDSLRQSALTRTAEALPWIGNAVGGAAEIVLGTAVLIKNGIGMAGAVIAVLICAVPVIQMLILAFLYKLAAALVQPVSDKRITGCISSVSEGYELLVKVVFTAGVLFLLTIAIVAASTT